MHHWLKEMDAHGRKTLNTESPVSLLPLPLASRWRSRSRILGFGQSADPSSVEDPRSFHTFQTAESARPPTPLAEFCHSRSRTQIGFSFRQSESPRGVWRLSGRVVGSKITLTATQGPQASPSLAAAYITWCGAMHGALQLIIITCNNMPSSIHTMSVVHTVSVTVWELKTENILFSSFDSLKTYFVLMGPCALAALLNGSLH